MRISLHSILVLSGLLIFSACNRSTVNLYYTNAKDEVPPLGNFTFQFDKSLVNDSLLNRWDSTEYISFEPKIPGRFRWEQPDQLVFSPSQPLAAMTSYTATLNGAILQFSKWGRIGGKHELSFHTPDLRIDNANVTWVLQEEHSSTAVPQMEVNFNYPVSPSVLKDKLQILVEGQPVKFNLQTLSAENKISLRLQDIKIEDKDYSTKIIIDKGMTSPGSAGASMDKIEWQGVIPSSLALRINDVTTENDGISGVIKVLTSQQVAPSDIAGHVSLDPAVKYTVEATDNGFELRSDNFNMEKSYGVTITKGLRGKIGGSLHEDYSGSVTFGQLEPSISFSNSKGVYLSQKGLQNVEVKIVNVEKLKVIISKIYENNLLAAQRFGYSPRDNTRSADEEGEVYDVDNSADATLGDVIYEKEIDTRSLPKYGEGRLFNFNVADRLPEFKGIYHVMLRSSKNYWVSDSRFISLSDIGLIAKEGTDKIMVFANSIKNAKAMSGVNIIAYGANNQMLGMGATNAEGVAEISYARKDFPGFRPAMLIAKTAEDFNYIPFNATRVNTSRFEVGGKRINNTGLDAFIYPERDIYRPGERVNFSVIIRDRQWKSPGDIPVKLKFLMPSGKELKTFRKSLNEQGSAEGSVDLATSAVTGSYSLEVYSSNDILLGTQSFRIEEFVPDRIKVTAKLDKPFLQPGDLATLQINAVNFFGPPAADRNYECEIQVKQKLFNPKKFRSYQFGLATQNSFFDKVEREGKTDEKGNASEKYEVKELYKNMGLLQATFYATVFDETGRPVSRSVVSDIYTQPLFLGVADDGYWYHPLNQPALFPVVALDKNENVLNGVSAKIEVVKHEYKTVLTKNGSYFRYESQKEDNLILSSNLTVSGENTHYSFTPRTPGDYELRVYIPGSNNYVSQTFYSYGNWGGDLSSFEVNNEGNVDIELDKTAYLTGEKVKALFKAPFSGRLLVTMETDKLLSYQYIDMDPSSRTASITLPLTREDIPNVYLTATLFKPHTESDIPLTVAHGYVSVKVEENGRKIPMEIFAQKTVRSKTHQKIRVRAIPNSMVTLAAVDNGVLQVSDFETPDPYSHFYAKRALDVNGYDIYQLLFPEIRGKLSSTGGDAEADIKKRVNPMPAKRFKLMSYWSGIKQANGNGDATFEFDIPSFSGEVRLMALSYLDEKFGSREDKMTVADPLVLSTALPRFLSPKDTVSVPVTITNTTGKPATAKATLKLSGLIQSVGDNQQSVTIAPNSEARVTFKVVAPPGMGLGKVRVEVDGLGEKFTDETEISIRPVASLQKITGSGSVSGGSSQPLLMDTHDFIPSTVDSKLLLSRSPAIELTKYLNMLVQYPYGCTEQTVSAAFPQLYYGDLADLAQGDKAGKATANYNIQEAIRKIRMRQLYNGGVTLWDNEGTEDWWATIYAAHFLLEAQKAGYDVDKGLLETILGYVNNRLRNRETIPYYYNRNQNKKIAPKEVVYGLYVLALANRPNVSTMNYYKSNPALLSLDCKYLLSAAFALAGDKNSFKQFLPSQFSGEESVAQTGGSFYSDIRDESIALNVLVDVDPGNAQIPEMARQLSEKLKQRYWYSTQELAFSFIALGKIARASAKSDVTAQVESGGKTIAVMNGGNLSLNGHSLKGNGINLATHGSGRLYYFWETSGVSTTGNVKEEDNYLKVRRHFFDRNGRPITASSFRQNDLIIVQISLEKSYSGELDNIVITDMLPAGFEIENPRTKEIPGMDWIKDAATPTSLDVRDDRINLFVNAHETRQVYYYAVRAVSPGIFHMGPVSADAMYNGEYHSYNGAGTIRVNP